MVTRALSGNGDELLVQSQLPIWLSSDFVPEVYQFNDANNGITEMLESQTLSVSDRATTIEMQEALLETLVHSVVRTVQESVDQNRKTLTQMTCDVEECNARLEAIEGRVDALESDMVEIQEGQLETKQDTKAQAEQIALNAATMAHSATDVELLVTVGSTGVHTLDAGNLTLFVEYVLTGDLS